MSDYNAGIATKLRGVNLGGWLVLEKWITPSLFQGSLASDETQLCLDLGKSSSSRRINEHRETFITERDFDWIARKGLNAVRIPVGHWIIDETFPYDERFKGTKDPYAENGLAFLDRAMSWAGERKLKVIIDLHAAPGSQNGFDHSGLAGSRLWEQTEEYIQHSVKVLERIAERYEHNHALEGIEILNEPHWETPTSMLERFSIEAYKGMQKLCPASFFKVIFSDAFRSAETWKPLANQSDPGKLGIDLHRYQCFAPDDNADPAWWIDKATKEWSKEAEGIEAALALPSYVGEWSLALPTTALRTMESNKQQMDAYMKAFALAQLKAFNKHAGWFFWTYKTEESPSWSFRRCIENGWITPDSYNSEQ